MPQAHQRMLGELAIMALSGELGEPKALDVGSGRGFLWKGRRGDRPMLSVHLMLQEEGGAFPVRLMIGDPCRAEDQMLTCITVEAAAEINGIIADIHRRMRCA